MITKEQLNTFFALTWFGREMVISHHLKVKNLSKSKLIEIEAEVLKALEAYYGKPLK